MPQNHASTLIRRKRTLKNNPRNTFDDKPTFAVRAHATMRIHGKHKRIEIGFRIPPDMEEHLYKILSERNRKSRKNKAAR
jgi:hypothetical protein